MSALDKVLAALDAGLQTSDEHGYPERIDHPELCARCLKAHHVDSGDLCEPCRAWCLGDSDVDPARAEPLSWLPDYAISRPTMAEANARMYVQNPQRVRVSRLDAEGRPTGETHELAGYAMHHRDGNPRNNDMSNLELVPLAENVACVAQPDEEIVSVSLCVEFVQPTPAAFRVATSIEVPEWYHVTCEACGAGYACDPERTQEAAGIMRNDGHGRENSCTLGLNAEAVAEMREDALQRLAFGLDLPIELLRSEPYDWAQEAEEARQIVEQHDWQAEVWRHTQAIGWDTSVEQVQALQRRIERSQP